MKVIATILSSFYFGILLGVAVCIYYHKQISELEEIQAYAKIAVLRVQDFVEGAYVQANEGKKSVNPDN